MNATDFIPEYLLRSSVETRAFARENGWECFAACPFDIWVDLDTSESISGFDELWKLFLELFPDAKIIRRSTSKSGIGQHVYVRMSKGYPDAVRIAMAASLGSDPKREMLSIVRVLNQDPEPVLFFELP
jgi:hypothetical protein